MASIKLKAIDKTYPNGQVAVRGLELEVADGELLVLVGPSGCGKTTILRLIAGLERPTAGRVYIDGRDATELPPQNRDLAMVFQNHALYPHLTVSGNLQFGLRMRRVSTEGIAERMARVAATLGLEPYLDKKPGQLSGGECQRVALGRALVRQPKVFLLDEPLSNLDAPLRIQTRAELIRLHRKFGATMLYVTHDQEEAMTLGNRIAVLRAGALQQLAAPMEVYRRPANTFVAGFIGAPPMNFFRGSLLLREGKNLVVSPSFAREIDIDSKLAAPAEVVIGIRPQEIKLVDSVAADIIARVDVVQPLGSTLLIHLRTADKTSVTMLSAANAKLDGEIGLHLPPEHLHLFDTQDGRRLN